jgi:heme-degrading monooxygenase HmoA
MIVIFRSRLRDENNREYQKLAPRMLELAQSMPGFVSFDAYTGEDGERVAIIEFESEETLKAWREHPEHLVAQKLGRSSFYSEYSLQVCERVRSSKFRFGEDSK